MCVCKRIVFMLLTHNFFFIMVLRNVSRVKNIRKVARGATNSTSKWYSLIQPGTRKSINCPRGKPRLKKLFTKTVVGCLKTVGLSICTRRFRGGWRRGLGANRTRVIKIYNYLTWAGVLRNHHTRVTFLLVLVRENDMMTTQTHLSSRQTT